MRLYSIISLDVVTHPCSQPDGSRGSWCLCHHCEVLGVCGGGTRWLSVVENWQWAFFVVSTNVQFSEQKQHFTINIDYGALQAMSHILWWPQFNLWQPCLKFYHTWCIHVHFFALLWGPYFRENSSKGGQCCIQVIDCLHARIFWTHPLLINHAHSLNVTAYATHMTISTKKPSIASFS